MILDAGEMIAQVTFWLSAALLVYVYVGYPLTLLLLPKIRRTTCRRRGRPSVTVLIAAFNEVAHIARTVRNKLSQTYPASCLDVVVVSDGSSDGTDEAVMQLGEERVRLIHQAPRQGKTVALNRGVEVARGEIVVFADANSEYDPHTIERMVDVFNDPRVGYVTGRLVYRDPGEAAVGQGSGLYMMYENWLRRLESSVGSVVGVNGGVDAVRRALYQAMRADHLPDLVLPLRVVEAGYRVVYCDEALSYEEALGYQDDEFRMRVRVALRALHALWELRTLLRPRGGVFAFQVFVHKILRYLAFIPQLALMAASVALSTQSFYAWAAIGQVLFYTLAAIGFAARGHIAVRPVFIPYYFSLLNAAAAVAVFRFLRGERQVLWTPRKGL